jgi:outer membrane biosynthesis protein TonB
MNKRRLPFSLQIARAQVAALIVFLVVTVGNSQTARDWSGYPESYAREVALSTALPIYPADAVRKGITDVVQAKIAINDQGQVAKIKINPTIDPLLKQAVADAVNQWTFKLRPEIFIGGRHCLSRLTFKFSIINGEPLVELYNPEPSAKDSERLGYWDGYKELRDWNKWEEVEPTKTP